MHFSFFLFCYLRFDTERPTFVIWNCFIWNWPLCPLFIGKTEFSYRYSRPTFLSFLFRNLRFNTIWRGIRYLEQLPILFRFKQCRPTHLSSLLEIWELPQSYKALAIWIWICTKLTTVYISCGYGPDKAIADPLFFLCVFCYLS